MPINAPIVQVISEAAEEVVGTKPKCFGICGIGVAKNFFLNNM